MGFPEWIRSGLYGAFLGATAVIGIGFNWGGWLTASGAARQSDAAARQAVVAAMVLVCLERSTGDPDREAKITAIQSAWIFGRQKEFMNSGWATMPGTETPDRDLTAACMKGISLDVS